MHRLQSNLVSADHCQPHNNINLFHFSSATLTIDLPSYCFLLSCTLLGICSKQVLVSHHSYTIHTTMSDAPGALNRRDVTRDIFSASIGSVACCYTGQPFDTVKVRMQTNPAAFPSVMFTSKTILSNEVSKFEISLKQCSTATWSHFFITTTKNF